MAINNIDVTVDGLDTEVNVSLSPEPSPIEVDGGEVIVIEDHNTLRNRDAEDQHPISAITGLDVALDNKAGLSDFIEHATNNVKHVTALDKLTWDGKQDALTAGTGITIVDNVISATGGGGGGNVDDVYVDGESVLDENKIAQIDLTGKADVDDVPTKTSDLTNDSGFITSADVPTDLADLSDDATHRLVTDTEKSTWSGKQDAIADLASIRTNAGKGATAIQATDYAGGSTAGVVKTSSTYGVGTNGSGYLYGLIIPAAQYGSSNSNAIVSKGTLDNQNFVSDGSYVHTDNNYTTTEKNKLSGLSNYDDTEVKNRLTTIEGKEAGWDAKADVSDIPTKTSELTNDSGFLTSHQSLDDYYTKTNVDTLISSCAPLNHNHDDSYYTKEQITTIVGKYTKTEDLADVALSNSYDDLDDLPTIPAEQVQADWNEVDSTKKSYIANKPTIPEGSVLYHSLGQNVDGAIDQKVVTDALADKVDAVSGKGLSTNDYTTTEKTKLAGLSNYDDTALDNRVSTIEGKESGWDAKYSKPSGGIPKTDLANAVQTSLGLADTALQSHQDISGKADTTYVDAQLALKADGNHTHNKVVNGTTEVRANGSSIEFVIGGVVVGTISSI